MIKGANCTTAAMHRLRQLAALRPVLELRTLPNLAQIATGEGFVHGFLPSSTPRIAPAMGLAAAASARGFAAGPQEPEGPNESIQEGRPNSSSNAGTSQPAGDQDAGNSDWLEDWGKLMDKGDTQGQAEFLHNTFGNEPVGPPLHELLNYNRKEEERAKRRMFELQKQEEIRQSRVAEIDEFGRSYGTGKRKTSIARVWLQQGAGDIVINGKRLNDYFALFERRSDVLAPLLTTNTLGMFDIRATVKGGGNTGQAQALRHGIAKALQLFDPQFRPPLKSEGLLARDSRIVERKKPGRAKARKSFQWVKR